MAVFIETFDEYSQHILDIYSDPLLNAIFLSGIYFFT